MDLLNTVLLVGGPDAGKTNYLHRLWLDLSEGKGLLKADGLPDNLEYLQAGSEKILACKFCPHTPKDVYNRDEIPFKINIDGEDFKAKLIIPDCSGETWLDIYRNREWSNEWENIISQTCSCLIFIRADSDQIVNPLDWISCTEILGVNEALPTSFASNHDEFEIPTQVILVDWLQFFKEAFTMNISGSYRPRIGIIIAAWDLVPSDQQKSFPEKYVEANFPMLFQFIKSNIMNYEFSYFGTSIFGGDPDSDMKYRNEILEEDPLKNGFVVYRYNNTLRKIDDFTIPIAWAIGLDINAMKNR